MKANELRIGNYYDHNGEVKQVTPRTIIDVWASERVWCKPIPLTEEWFIKLGFSKATELVENEIVLGFGIKIDDVNWISFNEGNLGIYDEEDGSTLALDIQVKYIHQLQNLYFALTGEELIIK